MGIGQSEAHAATAKLLFSSEMTELLIAGDSHITSFGAPLKSADGDHKLVRLDQQSGRAQVLVGPWPRQFDAYWDAVEAHAPRRAVAVLWGGNRHLAHYLFAPLPLFDFVVAEDPNLPLDEGALLIPEEAMRAFLAPPIRQLEKRVMTLVQRAAQVLIPGTPPPKEDDAFIRARFTKEPHFVRMADNLGLDIMKVPLSPALLRLKMWIALQGLLKDLAQKSGSTYVPVPAAARTESGFLHPSCYADDVTHANIRFGELMLNELFAANDAAG